MQGMIFIQEIKLNEMKVFEILFTLIIVCFVQDSSETVGVVLDMLKTILPSLTENYLKVSPMGSTQRAQKALYTLHNSPKLTQHTDELMVCIYSKLFKTSDRIFICTCTWNNSKDLLKIWLMKCLVFCVDCNPGLSGGSVWECEDELQWRPGPADQTADQLSLPEEGCHVCAGLPTWQKTASSRQSWERKDYHSTAICATQASWLQ